MTQLGCPIELVSNQGKQFLNSIVEELARAHMNI